LRNFIFFSQIPYFFSEHLKHPFVNIILYNTKNCNTIHLEFLKNAVQVLLANIIYNDKGRHFLTQCLPSKSFFSLFKLYIVGKLALGGVVACENLYT
jgi:hypothetical protein